ncbi:MAG: hypothetical protein WB755_01445, partial [Terriglobales bacterium]
RTKTEATYGLQRGLSQSLKPSPLKDDHIHTGEASQPRSNERSLSPKSSVDRPTKRQAPLQGV